MPKIQQIPEGYELILVFMKYDNQVVEHRYGRFPADELEEKREELLNKLLAEARRGNSKHGLLLDIKFVRTIHLPYDERLAEIQAKFFEDEHYQWHRKNHKPEKL